jgi:hypothetical protein
VPTMVPTFRVRAQTGAGGFAARSTVSTPEARQSRGTNSVVAEEIVLGVARLPPAYEASSWPLTPADELCFAKTESGLAHPTGPWP